MDPVGSRRRASSPRYKAGFTRAGAGVAIYVATLLALWPIAVPPTRSWAIASVPVAGIFAAFLAVLAMPIATLIDPSAASARSDRKRTQSSSIVLKQPPRPPRRCATVRSATDALAQLTGRTVHIEPWRQRLHTPTRIRMGPRACDPGLRSVHLRSGSPQRRSAMAGRMGRSGSSGSPQRTSPCRSMDGVSGSMPRSRRSRCCVDICRWWRLRAGRCWVASRTDAGRPSGRNRGDHRRQGSGGAFRAAARDRHDADLGVASDPLTKLQTLLYHAPPWTVSDGRTTARIPLGTAAEPNVIGATGPIGYCNALKLDPPPATVTVGPAQGAPGWDTPLTLEFAVIPVAGEAPGVACP